MAFQDIKPLPRADELLDIAIRKANKRASFMKKKRGEDHFNHIKNKELARFVLIKDELTERLKNIKFQFSTELIDFYKKLVDITIGTYELKRSVESLDKSGRNMTSIFQTSQRSLKLAKDEADLNRIKKSFYGRISSVIKKIDFTLLIKARTEFQNFPVIKTRYKQLAIAGFPNVGKSTLLSKLSNSNPEIAAYAFTTKNIMIGYMGKIQLLDTPGTLNRFNKMNFIEQQASLILEMIAEKIIYIFDLTEPYPIEDQIKLYNKIKALKKPMIIYFSKTDILDENKVKKCKKRFDGMTKIEELKKCLKQTSTQDGEKE